MPSLKRLLKSIKRIFWGKKRRKKKFRLKPRRLKSKRKKKVSRKRKPAVKRPKKAAKRPVLRKKSKLLRPPVAVKIKKQNKGTAIGTITHFFSRISVGVVKLSGPIAVNDAIRIVGKNGEFVQKVKSLQIESVDVPRAGKGHLVGLKLEKESRPGDQVYKIVY